MTRKQRFYKQLIIATIVTAIMLAIGIVGLIQEYSSDGLLGVIIVVYLAFAYTFTVMEDGSVVQLTFLRNIGRGVRLPGIIFYLDLRSIAIMLLYKFIIAPIIILIIGIFFFIWGIFLSLFLSIFTFPYYLILSIKDLNKNKVTQAEFTETNVEE